MQYYEANRYIMSQYFNSYVLHKGAKQYMAILYVYTNVHTYIYFIVT